MIKLIFFTFGIIISAINIFLSFVVIMGCAWGGGGDFCSIFLKGIVLSWFLLIIPSLYFFNKKLKIIHSLSFIVNLLIFIGLLLNILLFCYFLTHEVFDQKIKKIAYKSITIESCKEGRPENLIGYFLYENFDNYKNYSNFCFITNKRCDLIDKQEINIISDCIWLSGYKLDKCLLFEDDKKLFKSCIEDVNGTNGKYKIEDCNIFESKKDLYDICINIPEINKGQCDLLPLNNKGDIEKVMTCYQKSLNIENILYHPDINRRRTINWENFPESYYLVGDIWYSAIKDYYEACDNYVDYSNNTQRDTCKLFIKNYQLKTCETYPWRGNNYLTDLSCDEELENRATFCAGMRSERLKEICSFSMSVF